MKNNWTIKHLSSTQSCKIATFVVTFFLVEGFGTCIHSVSRPTTLCLQAYVDESHYSMMFSSVVTMVSIVVPSQHISCLLVDGSRMFLSFRVIFNFKLFSSIMQCNSSFNNILYVISIFDYLMTVKITKVRFPLCNLNFWLFDDCADYQSKISLVFLPYFERVSMVQRIHMIYIIV